MLPVLSSPPFPPDPEPPPPATAALGGGAEGGAGFAAVAAAAAPEPATWKLTVRLLPLPLPPEAPKPPEPLPTRPPPPLPLPPPPLSDAGEPSLAPCLAAATAPAVTAVAGGFATFTAVSTTFASPTGESASRFPLPSERSCVCCAARRWLHSCSCTMWRDTALPQYSTTFSSGAQRENSAIQPGSALAGTTTSAGALRAPNSERCAASKPMAEEHLLA
mmetsp:Transcript_2313/g.9632  ORF Transcript_2313/g.9632 Transcript_2313/m.9632 type:complete len:219 (-) Transcript_2313:963-1619(-)